MGTDFYSLNKVLLIGQIFLVTKIDEKKKTLCLRMRTREIFLYGAGAKNKAPTSYYHLIKTTGSLAEYCAKYVRPGDVIFCEGRIRNFASTQDKTTWKSVILADRLIMLCPLESLKDDLKEKFKSAIDKK